MASITGKNRDRGSIFSQETARATGDLTNRKYFSTYFYNVYKYCSEKTFLTYKKQAAKFFCSESNRSQNWLLLQAKFETEAQILAKRPERGYWRPRIQKNFASCFLFLNRLSMQIFIKIWYTENNIVKN